MRNATRRRKNDGPRIRLMIVTEVSEGIVIQRIRYFHRFWFDRQLIPDKIRRQVEALTALKLKIIDYRYEKRDFIRRYEYETDVDIHEHDGRYYMSYNRRRKICHNCVGWNPKNRYCDWKGEILMREITGCDGFMERIRTKKG